MVRVSEAETEKKQGFKVNDQRRFNADGSVRDGESDDSPVPSDEAKEPIPPESDKKETFSAEPESNSNQESGALPADISTLILSLATSAQMGMGLVPHPASGAVQKNLNQARHAIDMLGVIQEKTRGNLTSEEDQLLQAVLTELRMGIVELQRSGA